MGLCLYMPIVDPDLGLSFLHKGSIISIEQTSLKRTTKVNTLLTLTAVQENNSRVLPPSPLLITQSATNYK